MSIIDQIRDGITNGDSVISLVQEALQSDAPAAILDQGAVAGIQRAGELWQEGTFFMPDVILAAESFKEAMEALDPHLASDSSSKIGKFLIGVVEGDVHDLGKSIVIALLRAGGFEVIDLGCNVPTSMFVEKVKEHGPDLVGIGAYMSTTMLQMKHVVQALADAGLRNGVKVMVGGSPVTAQYAEDVGADDWGKDAVAAVNNAKRLLGK